MNSGQDLINLRIDCFNIFNKAKDLTYSELDFISALLYMSRLPIALYTENQEMYYSLLRTEIIYAINTSQDRVLTTFSTFLKNRIIN